MEDTCFATASALAEDIRAGGLTTVEVLEAHAFSRAGMFSSARWIAAPRRCTATRRRR